MNTREAYDLWSQQYDTNTNKTRDLEARALRNMLAPIAFDSCLEIGCGTGKNTEWLLTKAQRVTAVDLSDSMLAKAKEKISSEKVNFVRADINQDWQFATGSYDLATASLVLEHIENLEPIFEKWARVLAKDGHVYVGELHPFKQYSGSKARFESEQGLQVLSCFNHHISDFVASAKQAGFQLLELDESFDDDDRRGIPRILCLLFKKIR